MKKQQISFSVAPFMVDIFKKEALLHGISLSEFISQTMLRIVLQANPNLLGLTDPFTERICEIIRREEDADYFDSIKKPDFSGEKKYSSVEEFEKDLEAEEK